MKSSESISENDHRTSKRYALTQTALLVLFAGIVFFTPRDYLFVSTAIRAAGNVLCTLGVLVIVFAVISLGRVIQISPEPKAGGELIQGGVYKYLRHPIYTGMVFCVLGLFLRTPTIWIGIATLIVIVFLFFKARFEEKLLIGAYSDYANYRERSWGLFPGLR